MKHELLTKKELADRFGVDVRSITNWAADGMPQRTRSGKPAFAWPECREWRDEKIRNDARALRHAGGSEEYKLEMAELNLRERRAEVEAAEFVVAEQRRQVVTVDFMLGETERILQAIRSRLLSIPSAWSVPLGSCATTVDRQLKLQDLVNEMMPLLQSDVDDDGEAAATVDSEDLDEAAAEQTA